jgi:hypothetical protein
MQCADPYIFYMDPDPAVKIDPDPDSVFILLIFETDPVWLMDTDPDPYSFKGVM